MLHFDQADIFGCYFLYPISAAVSISTVSRRPARLPETVVLDNDCNINVRSLATRESRRISVLYRHAMILLPWFFLLLLRNGPKRHLPTEISLFMVSVAINAIAAYLFLWTNGSDHSRVELATSDLLAIDAEKATVF